MTALFWRLVSWEKKETSCPITLTQDNTFFGIYRKLFLCSICVMLQSKLDFYSAIFHVFFCSLFFPILCGNLSQQINLKQQKILWANLRQQKILWAAGVLSSQKGKCFPASRPFQSRGHWRASTSRIIRIISKTNTTGYRGLLYRNQIW